MKIKINHDTWTIKRADDDAAFMNDIDGSCFLGLTDYEHLKIYIRRGMPRTVTRATLLHELAHAFMLSHACHVEDVEAVCDFVGAYADAVTAVADELMGGL